MNNILMKGKVKIQLKNSETEVIEYDSGWIDNVCPTVGRTALAEILVGNNTKSNPGKITYCAVGTGSTTPAITGIKLATELARTSSIVSSNVDNTVTIQGFFLKSEANGVLTEVGLFGEDATATADSGTMFQWITLSPNVTKANTQTLLVTSVIPISYI